MGFGGFAVRSGDAAGFAVHYWDGEALLSHFEVAGPRNVIANCNINRTQMLKAFIDERGTG